MAIIEPWQTEVAETKLAPFVDTDAQSQGVSGIIKLCIGSQSAVDVPPASVKLLRPIETLGNPPSTCNLPWVNWHRILQFGVRKFLHARPCNSGEEILRTSFNVKDHVDPTITLFFRKTDQFSPDRGIPIALIVEEGTRVFGRDLHQFLRCIRSGWVVYVVAKTARRFASIRHRKLYWASVSHIPDSYWRGWTEGSVLRENRYPDQAGEGRCEEESQH